MEYGRFDEYIEVSHMKKRQTQEDKPEQSSILPGDTAASLKRKRNGGACERLGCSAIDNVEWHHHNETWLCSEGHAAVAAEIKDWGGARGVKRFVSKLQPTTNKAVLDAYAAEIQKCTLLCKMHHEQTHTLHLQKKSRLQLQHAAARRLATWMVLVRQYGQVAAARAMLQLEKLAN
jgi:hypothetical protein